MSVDIFVSYRRDDEAGVAGRVFDRLSAAIGRDHVFMDVATVKPAENFHQTIAESLKECTYFLALVGPRWLSSVGRSGLRRLDDPADFVRQEIAAALQKSGLHIIPVLCAGATMPAEEELPAQIRGLARLQALSLRHTHFDSDFDEILKTIKAFSKQSARAQGVATAGEAEERPLTPKLKSVLGTVAVVDDDPNIRISVSIALEGEGYRVQTYTDGAEALDGLRANPPDLVILDIKMPRMDGVELLHRMRQSRLPALRDMPVIFLTSKDEEIDELFGLEFGGDDYVHKPFSQRLLVARVKAILRRASLKRVPAQGPCLAAWSDIIARVKAILRSASVKKAPAQIEPGAEVLERGALVMDPVRHTCTWRGVPVMLTVTEFLLLQSLAQQPGVVESRNVLMDAAYDDQVYVDDRTIDAHIKRLRKKFKAVDPDFEMIETLYGVGYRFKEA